MLRAPEAIALLGVKRATLYSYVSRGWIRAVADPDGAGNLYDREDLERLRQRHDARAGHGPTAAGALSYGEPILTTSISCIGAEGPVYRGHSAIELAASGASFESVCQLLWGMIPSAAPAQGLAPTKQGLAPTKQGLAPIERRLAQTASSRVGAGPRAGTSSGPPLLRMLSIAAEAAAAGESEEPHQMLRCLAGQSAGPSASSLAAALAIGLGVSNEDLDRVAPLLNRALILCADHELTASTFAVRIAASTGASLWASLCAGLAALSGPRHGGAPPLVAAFVAGLAKPEQAPALVTETLRQRRAPPGFGHPLYPEGDPRGAALLDIAARYAKPQRLRFFDAIATAVFAATGERPSLDFGLAALVHGLGLAPEAASAIFGLGRSAGLIAHALEQRRDGRLLRPRARYLAAPESPPASIPPARSAPLPRARGR